jgi:hypothetical protein
MSVTIRPERYIFLLNSYYFSLSHLFTIKASDDDVIVPKIAASVARGPRAKKFGSGAYSLTHLTLLTYSLTHSRCSNIIKSIIARYG